MTRIKYGCALGIITVLISVAIWRPWDTARADWLRAAIQEVRAYGPPSAADLEVAARNTWRTSKYLVFSNGWAAFKMHSMHSPGPVGDAAVLVTSNGESFRSFQHLCKGIGWRIQSRPGNSDEYMRTYGRDERWERAGKVQPEHAADGSQPSRLEPNRTPSAAGSHR